MAFTVPRDWTAGEFVTEAMLDAHIRDQFLAMGPHLIARKTSDQSVTSSTVLVDCTSMVLPVGVSEVWQFSFNVLYSAGTTGDLKLGFTFPTGGRIDAMGVGFSNALAAAIQFWSDTTSPSSTGGFGGQGSSIRMPQPINGIYTNGGTGGNLTLQFAQSSSDATSTTVYTNSTLWAVKLA